MIVKELWRVAENMHLHAVRRRYCGKCYWDCRKAFLYV